MGSSFRQIKVNYIQMKFNYKTLLLFLFLIVVKTPYIQAKNIVEKMEPNYWWTNFNYKHLKIALKGQNLAQSFFKINYAGITFNKVIFTKSPNVIFIDINIDDNVLPGNVPIEVYQKGRLQEKIYFQIKNRNHNKEFRPIENSDILYSIIIDRFANGNSDNDYIKEYLEKPNNNDISGIHGGDIKGISNHLNYIKSLGVSAIELSPLYESNQIFNSYYHDEVTNFYNIDQRLGKISDMINLSSDLKLNNLKYIQSFTLHKASKNNWLFKDEKIINAIISESKEFSTQEYSYSLQTDPYSTVQDFNKQLATKYDINTQFLNQNESLVSDFLIQNTIWWIEQINPDAIKIEDCQLNKLAFIQKLSNILMKLYPNLGIIYDYDTKNADELAYWEKNLVDKETNYIYDYPVSKILESAFSQFNPPNKSNLNLHKALSKDFNYNNPEHNILFIDNKNTSRAFTLAEKSKNQIKMLATYLFTTRGIPSLFYGSEYLLEGNLMRGESVPKKNFPGGWKDDIKNGFEVKNISFEENDYHYFIRQLIKYRNENPVIYEGQILHSICKDGVYSILKSLNEKEVVIIYNNNNSIEKVNLFKCFTFLNHYKLAHAPIENIELNDLKNILIESKTALIIELKK